MKNTEKQFKKIGNAIPSHGFNKADSTNRSAFALAFSKPASSLAVAKAALFGCLIYAVPAHAGFDIPTGLAPSPLCYPATLPDGRSTVSADGQPNALCVAANGAKPIASFTAQLALFEEFGTKPMGSYSASTPFTTTDCNGNVDGTKLDDFLKEGLHSVPTRRSDQKDNGESILPTDRPNLWETKVKDCLGLAANMAMPGDGRPTGEWFAHQRWDEFPAKVYFQTAMTGARDNGGLRDNQQLHGYSKGEFGPRGLYYLDANNDGTPGTKGIPPKFHPDLPAQNPQSLWTFDGTYPMKLLMARYGESILFRHYNANPINPGANAGFGKNTITTHEHNGHNGAESDGFAHAYFYPGQFYDYHWPMVLAGHDSINTDASDPKTGAPDGNGGIIKVRGDWRETMSTHWFHDHMLDYTAQNVYKGNAAMMNYYSAIDRGNEGLNDGVNLRLPSGTSMDWGNRDYDINLAIGDKAWDNKGQLKFNIFNTDGYLGDRITVNLIYKPFLEVRPRSYRFRVLNASVSRFYKIAVVKELQLGDPTCTDKINVGSKCYTRMDSYMIANDGNIMQHAVKFPNTNSLEAWPEQGIAERYDMIVDFKGMEGKKVSLFNLAEHQNGAGPSKYVALADVLSGKYVGDPGVGKFLEFRVQNGCKDFDTGATITCNDLSMKPADYVEGKKQMIPLNKPTAAELQAAVQRTFEFGRANGTDQTPWTIKTDGGAGLNADMNRISAAPTLPDQPNGKGKVEIWHIKNGGNGWSHPVHVHFEEGQLLYRNGSAPPPWEKYARKDVYRIGGLKDSGGSVDMYIRIREFAGTYVEHCHNTQHEDKAMLLRWDSEHPGQTIGIPTPEAGWDGVNYIDSIYLPTAKTGDLAAKQGFKLP